MTIANGKTIPINRSGSSTFLLQNSTVHLNAILLAAPIEKNLLSVFKFCSDNSVSLRFDKKYVYLKDVEGTGQEPFIGYARNGLYQISLEDPTQEPDANYCSASPDLQMWHARFGHFSEVVTRGLISKHNLSSSKNKFQPCKSCVVAKHHRLPSNSIHTRSKFPLDLVYGDVWGPAPSMSVYSR